MSTSKHIFSGIIFQTLLLFALPFSGLIAATNLHAATGHTSHWGYSGATGPDEWDSLSKEYALCGSGKRQSPVDIWNETPSDLYPLQFQYQPIPLLVLNNGHTLQANYNTLGQEEKVTIGGKSYPVQRKPVHNSTLMLGDVPYKLLQFHFHTPSEHAHEGERYAMEVHLVHKSADGNLAVIGVLLKRGKENPTLRKVLDNVSGNINEVKLAQGVTINAADLLPADRQLFHYSGSLTTPPCSENVNWFVMKTPVEVSDAQVKQFARLVGKNARPLQPMHWRSMLTSD
ncbi:carbonic anhydrase [Candidatus Thiodiazotropha sp. CDECU1]|uniref:carbonic anhydrase n=1 Tax=Candidatus Thiodiazotropha sp. CDECU1 TaxID=3065865 RepID=UPI00292E4B05|nr:carbonic anhydrase family protein [Candidatus Thiodiazotropha sp. CDECU1]